MLICGILWNGDLNSPKPNILPQKKHRITNFPIERIKTGWHDPSLLLLIKFEDERHILTKYFSEVRIFPLRDRHFGYSNKMNKHTMLSTHASFVMRGLISKKFTCWMMCRINILAWMWRPSCNPGYSPVWWRHITVFPMIFSWCMVCLSPC